MIVTNASDRTTALSQVFVPAPRMFRMANFGMIMAASRPVSHPAVDEDDLPPEVLDDLRVVGGEDERRPEALVELDHRVQDLVGVLGVEVGRRLVGQDDLGLLDHGPGDGDPLVLAARHLAGPGAGPVGQADPGQGVHHRLAPGRRGHPQEEERELDVLVGRVDRQEVEGLEDEPDVVVAEARRRLCGVKRLDVLAQDLGAGPRSACRASR